MIIVYCYSNLRFKSEVECRGCKMKIVLINYLLYVCMSLKIDSKIIVIRCRRVKYCLKYEGC